MRASQRKSETAWLRKLAKDTAREQLRRARLAVRDAKAAKRAARTRANETCAAARVALKEWRTTERERVRLEIARLRAELRSGLEERRERVRKCCGPDRLQVRAESDSRIAAMRAALAAMLDERRRERTWSGKAKAGAPSSASSGTARRERREEGDHDVEVNLSPDQLLVWREVKGRIKATPRMSRTEAFLQWMHDHSADVARIVSAEAEKAYKQAVREEAAHRAMASNPPQSESKLREYISTGLEAIGVAGSVRPPAHSVPEEVPSFARKVKQHAWHNPRVVRFHDDRAFIASIFEATKWGGMSLGKFKALCLEAQRAGLLRLTRADLVGDDVDPALVARSETDRMGASFHFVALDPPAPPNELAKGTKAGALTVGAPYSHYGRGTVVEAGWTVQPQTRLVNSEGQGISSGTDMIVVGAGKLGRIILRDAAAKPGDKSRTFEADPQRVIAIAKFPKPGTKAKRAPKAKPPRGVRMTPKQLAALRAIEKRQRTSVNAFGRQWDKMRAAGFIDTSDIHNVKLTEKARHYLHELDELERRDPVPF